MPGYEVIGKKEKENIIQIFEKSNGVLFRHGFNNIRNNNFITEKFEKKFAQKFNTKYALAVSSGTAALRIAIAALEIPKNSEIISQSFTFVATVEAIVESGCVPICTDIDDSLNMCVKDLEKKITKKTKAIIIVHMLGHSANLEEIKKICKKYNIFLIEDTAWGIGGKYKKKYLGTVGDIGTFSFDFAKTITTGEGGMCVFKKKAHYQKAKAWHDHGHENNPRLPRWEDSRSSSGFNFRITELQSSIGLAQLEKFNNIFKMHAKNKLRIQSIFKKFNKINFRKTFKNTESASEAFIFSLKNKNQALKFREELLKAGISTKILPEAMKWHFALYWTHIKEIKKNKSRYKKSYDILSKCVSIPIFYYMDEIFFKKIELVASKILNEK